MRPRDERTLRSLGIFTVEELDRIRASRVGVAGLGMGGSMFINLVRLGIEHFHVADPDSYERTNVNRQRLAKESTLGKRKDECLILEAKDINPEIKVKTFSHGIQPACLADFVDGLDLILDIVDVFAFAQKAELHHLARAKGIPVMSCATFAFGGSLVVFDQNTPSFAELTGFDPKAPHIQNLERFCRFICPEIPLSMRKQLYQALDQSTHIPFVTPGCELTAAMATTEAAKILVGWPGQWRAPQGFYIDPLEGRAEVFRADYRARLLAPLIQNRKAA